MPSSNEYSEDPTPGAFDHRSDNCSTHGNNVPFFRQRGVIGPYFCVQCALRVLREANEVEVQLLTTEDIPQDKEELEDWLKENGA